MLENVIESNIEGTEKLQVDDEAAERQAEIVKLEEELNNCSRTSVEREKKINQLNAHITRLSDDLIEKSAYLKNIDNHYSEIIKGKEESLKEMTKITTDDDELSTNFKRLLIKKLTEKETNNIKEICREMKCCDMQTQTDPCMYQQRDETEEGTSGGLNDDGVCEKSHGSIDVVDMVKKVDLSHIQSEAVHQVPLTTLRVMNLPPDFGVKEVEDLFGLSVVSVDVKKKISTQVSLVKKNKVEVKIVAPVIIAEEIERFHNKKLHQRVLKIFQIDECYKGKECKRKVCRFGHIEKYTNESGVNAGNNEDGNQKNDVNKDKDKDKESIFPAF